MIAFCNATLLTSACDPARQLAFWCGGPFPYHQEPLDKQQPHHIGCSQPLLKATTACLPVPCLCGCAHSSSTDSRPNSCRFSTALLSVGRHCSMRDFTTRTAGLEVEQPVEQLLQDKLQLQDRPLPCKLQPTVITQSVSHVQSAFGDLLAMNPTSLISPLGGGDREREAKMWDCFAEVYELELQQLQKGSRGDLSKEKKRQILADILVWAEITQSHYDSNTAEFVTEPHCGDDSFQRIGKLFKAAKQQRGLA